MNRLPLILTILFSLLVSLPAVMAQTGIGIRAGAAMPLADFNDDNINGNNSGGANTGFTVGIDYTRALGGAGLALTVSADAMVNPLDDEVKQSFKDLLGENAVDPFFTYINIPVYVALDYTINPGSPVAVYATAGVGLDALILTKMKIHLNNITGTYNFDPSTAFGFKVGAGLRFNEKLSLNFLYNLLGTHTLKGKIEYDGNSDELDPSELDVTIATITAGYSF